jgi:hypothetical protein
MAKKNQITKSRTTKKCRCNVCNQVANAQVGTSHVFCKGMSLDILSRLPNGFRNMTNPIQAAKAVWVSFEESNGVAS